MAFNCFNFSYNSIASCLALLTLDSILCKSPRNSTCYSMHCAMAFSSTTCDLFWNFKVEMNLVNEMINPRLTTFCISISPPWNMPWKSQSRSISSLWQFASRDMLRGIGTSRGNWDLKALNGSPRQVSNEFMIVHKRFGFFLLMNSS